MLEARLSSGHRVFRGAPRSGISLIETAAAMSACVILLGATLTALIAVQHADRRHIGDRNSRLGTAPLTDRLRDDLHACRSFAWNESERTLRLVTPTGGQIVFARTPGRWLRTDSAGLETTYRRPAGQQLRVEPAAGTSGDLARVQLYANQRAAAGESAERASTELVVEVGRDARLLAK